MKTMNCWVRCVSTDTMPNDGWGVSSTVAAKFFEVAEVGDIIKHINSWADLDGITEQSKSATVLDESS